MASSRPVAALLLLAAALACGDSTAPPAPPPPAPPAVAARLGVALAPSATVANRAVLPVQPQIRLETAQGGPVAQAGVTVTVALTAGGGTLSGAAQATTNAQGIASFGGLLLSGTVGPRTLTFSSPGLTSVDATVTITAGAPAAMAIQAGDGQTEAEGVAVPVAPAVKVVDEDANPVSGVAVTYMVTAGGGGVTGATPVTNADGIAAVGAWTLGAAGPNGLQAAAAALPTVAFTATAVRLPVASVAVSAPSSAPLLPEATRQLTATARDSVGRPLVGRTFAWSTTTGTILAVSPTGLVTATLPGEGVATATSEGVSGSLAVQVIAPTLTKEFWFTGHIGTSINNYAGPPSGFEHGFGYYTSIHTLWPEQPLDVQLGWGTWLYPDNRAFGAPLCPVGTRARDTFPTWGPTWDGVYQTIEGGAGAWLTNRFPSARTKFRINAVPDCYDTEINSPGWSFHGERLPANRLGLAQLSNRLLVPPDGFVFTTSGLFGAAWMALPLIPAYTSAAGLEIGNRSMTLFANATNFKGAVAFFTPEIWELVHLSDPTARTRGHDAQPLHATQMSVEMGSVAFFTGTAGGVRYRRLPRIAFPADGSGRAILTQGAQFFSKAAAWDPIAAWMQGGPAPIAFAAAGASVSLQQAGLTVRLGGDEVTYPAGFTLGALAGGAGPALGLQWAGSALETGVFPEYYREVSTNPSLWMAVPASEVPRTTWLVDQEFAPMPPRTFPNLDISPGGLFASATWSAGPFTTTLSDGSRVDYAWYRFVDQPAIARLQLAPGVLTALQALVESFHDQHGLAGMTLPPPAAGNLASLDAAMFVVPPAGLERGHVPIVIRQY